MLAIGKIMQPNEPDRNIEIQAIVQGRVQGVGFRATVKHNAMRLGLVGTVCNMPDGSVKIHVLGPDMAIKDFLTKLQNTSGFASISNISTREISPQHSYDEFRII